MTIKMKNSVLIYRSIFTLLFIYIFVQYMSMKRDNFIYNFYNEYVMNKYCIFIYIIAILLLMYLDKYIAILLFILIVIPYRFVFKEFFEDGTTTTIPNNILGTTTTIPKTTKYEYLPQKGTSKDTLNKLLESQYLGLDDRFKMDEISKNEILRQIRAQVDFDPYKTNLAKDVIYEIYNRYFDNDIFVKLKNVNDDSKDYIASGNFRYLPEGDRVDFDQITYQNLNYDQSFGVNPLTDGISNKTVVNRG